MSTLGFYIDDSEKQLGKEEREKQTNFRNQHSKPKSTVNLKNLPFRVYRVLIKYPQSQAQVNYEITACGQGVANNVTQIQFHKDRFYINGLTPKRVADELAILTTRALYPMVLHFNYIEQKQKIINLKEIQQNWNKLTPYLQREYGGAFFDIYQQTIQEHLANPKQFCKSVLTNDLFFALYSHSIYGEYSEQFEKDTTFRFTIGEYNQSLLFRGKQWMEKEYNHVGGVFVYFHGQAKKEGINYKLEVEYNLEKQRFTIKDIRANLFRMEEGRQELLAEIGIWQQREKELPADYEKQYEEEKKKLEEDEVRYQKYLKNKGKGWFDRLFGF